MEIYLDFVILLNFLVDFLLLLGTNRLSGFPPGTARCASSALLGAAYAAGCFLPGFAFLGSLLWRTVFLCLMGGLAFGCSLSAVKRSALFCMLSMALGGIALSMGRGDLPALILAAGAVWLLCRLSFDGRAGGSAYLPVTLRYGGNVLHLTALRDTGNTLRDPITGEQVLVISAAAAEKLTGLSQQALGSPLETLAKHPIPGLRLIPYRAVGQGGSLLLAMRLRDVTIGSRRHSAIVAFAPEGLGTNGMYQALAGGMV